MKDWKFIAEKWILRRHRASFFEPRVKKRLRRFRGRLFVDIGANQGLYSIWLAHNFSQIYAFEPNPRFVEVLKGQLERMSIANVKVFPMALGDNIGRTKLYLDSHVGFGGMTDTILPILEYKPNFIPEGGEPHVYVGEKGIEVDVSTYDRIVKEPADLVKIDVEGAEFLVLDGMKDALSSDRICNLLIELHNRDRKSHLEALLSKYSQEWIDPDHLLCTTS